ncbi:hypothetical protein A2331_00535 [Candidatus Falkowbacteria bacterium RIFOXYB2_FULL_34_18]|uniref:Cohesin domain-containing protein n=1 Tax=Candidatus Falkowbacteria bacterium RIFOXYD2_FULL_34_120 TaxID=1798007 RepID=A0A1F5TP25_9BACT|nr:MAG: hypothetical protein A2331_00535 [Candidatus Falkowbacteria bacterium RIFOXYB2_FULL_34_18]OGF29041.1 MAG: hypothetical protein A2500_01935 [Candidatus Falkowbacteria bacterium RIFOXYC12_FULL_34_55]OGF36074.1 MAG: hypothetical protein A2466_00235 [Candidatus Falkowbacteria bacterium RIFOXYC2_FULL_34_220]OGF38552.1 MAG: hypothetical protein A2515_05195 [Candidatus Falkowbacteria bacterium RIFOXYD12_FULL_34_57]OGF40703.1 MAG: hypothetical protein A2531_05675 [Candidatus Falkowbacteria bact
MRGNKFNFIYAVFICFVFVCGVFAPQKIQAAGASLYLTPSTGTHVINSTFRVSVMVNSGGEPINAAEGSISYDTNFLEATAVSKGNVFMFWTAEPAINGGNIRFGGGSPSPYTGTAGHVISITFKAKKAGDAQVRFTSGAVLANDGKGTNILASMGSASYKVSPYIEAPKQDATSKEPAKPQEVDYNKPKIESITHPDSDSWYNKTTAEFKWELPVGVTDISIDFNKEPADDPGSKSDGLLSEKKYENIEHGIWYLHLKFKDAKKWGTIAHFKIMVDTKSPLDFKIEVKEEEAGDWPELSFATKDEDSGMGKYEIFIGSLEHQAHELNPETTTLKVSDLSVGDHTVMVRATDKVGNEIVKTVDFTINPIEAPVITEYPKELKSSDKFYVSGTATINSTINVNVLDGEEVVLSGETKSDSAGNWFYIHESGLPNGRYIAWATAKNENGIGSRESNRVSFLVSPPIFTVIGDFVINYFTVFVSLIFMIILIIILSIYLSRMIKKKLKKETIEVEDVLHNNLGEIRKELNAEFDRLQNIRHSEVYAHEKEKAKQRLNIKIGEVEKKIFKEVKDVEDLLK